MKHTPAPWNIEWSEKGGLFIEATDLAGKVKKVAIIPSNTNVTKEDASLISAAPDLLDVAKRAADIMPLSGSEGFSPTLLALYEDIKKAIAKAEGK